MIGIRLRDRLDALSLERGLLRMAEARFDLALAVGIPHEARQPDGAVVREDVAIERIERKVTLVPFRDRS